MEKKSVKYYILAIFLILPVASLPLLIRKIRTEKYAIILFSILMGMLAYIAIPLESDDLAIRCWL